MEQSTQQAVNNITEQVVLNPEPKHPSIKTSVVLVIMLVLFGAIGYAYYRHQNPITLGKVVVNTLDAVRDSKIKSVEFSANINANLKDFDKIEKSNTAFPFPPEFNSMSLSMSWDGIFDGTVKNSLEAYGKVNLNIKIDASGGSEIASILGTDPLEIEFEYYAFPDSIYFKINKIPSIADKYTSMQGVNLSSYLDRWFVLHETEIKLFQKGFMQGFTEQAKMDNVDFGGFNLSDENYEKLKLAILKYLDQSGAIIISDRKNEITADGQKVTALYVKFDKDKYLPAIKSVQEDLKGIFPDIFTNINTDDINIYDDDLFMTTLDTDMGVKVFVGSDGYFHGEEASIDIKATDNMPSISEHAYLSLKNYNKSFNLQKPANAQTFLEAIMEMKSPQ